MIASHDSYTYLPSTNLLFNIFKGPWKAQTKTIQEQYAAGVRYFDIRIKRETIRNKNLWRLCHGLANLEFVFSSIKNICAYFDTLDGTYYRIILEKGNEEDKKAFREEILSIKDSYPHFNWCVIKENWETLFNKGGFVIEDVTCKLNTFGEIMGLFDYGLSILNWAQWNNPAITKSMITDEKTVYFFDGL